jgi:hypothetical protein
MSKTLSNRLERLEEKLGDSPYAIGIIHGDLVHLNGETMSHEEFSRRYPRGAVCRVVTVGGPAPDPVQGGGQGHTYP